VVPVYGDAAKTRLIAVLDVDSDKVAAFDELDQEWLERLCDTVFATDVPSS
jgi:L-methionine (R)-S-oxide reductase